MFVLVLECVIVPVAYSEIFSATELLELVEAFAIGTMVLAISCIAERATGVNVLLRFPTIVARYQELQDALITRDGVIRVRGPFANPVYLGGIVPLFVFAGLSLCCFRKRMVLGCSVLVAAATVAVLSVSRTAIYGGAVVALTGWPALLGAMSDKKRKVRIFFYVGIAVMALLAGFWHDVKRASLVAVAPTSDAYEGANVTSRAQLMTEGIPLIARGNPFGLGFDEQAIDRTQQLSPDVANFYVGYGLVRGWVWMIAFFSVVLAIFARLAKVWGPMSYLLAALLVGLLATYFGYAEYWVSFPTFLILFMVHDNRQGAVQPGPAKSVSASVSAG
jgi:hypothetical protein